MDISKFKIFPDNKELTIPFKINESGLAKWLQSLDNTTEYSSCGQVLKALQVLNEKDIEPKLRLALLEDIDLAIFPLIKRLELPLLGAKIPLATAEQGAYELIATTYHTLAQGFWRIAEDVTALSQQEAYLPLLAKALLNGLEALRKVLLFTAEVYEQPYSGFWLFCYQFYRRAEKYDLLELKLGDNAGEGCHFIGASFNCLLAFYLSGPNQYSQKDIKSLNKFCEQFSKHALVYRKIAAEDVKLFFKFLLDRDAPPDHVQRSNGEDSEVRYFTAVKIAKIAYDNLNLKATPLLEFRALKPAQLAQVVKSLGMGTHRKFRRVAEKKNYWGIIGYDHILDHLRKLSTGGSSTAVEPYDPRIAGNWKLPDLKLIPLEHNDFDSGWTPLAADSDKKHADFKVIWPPQGVQQGRSGNEWSGEFEIVDSSVKGYGILLKENNLKVGVGEFIAIVIDGGSKKERIEVGIIRRIGKAEPVGVILGVELLAAQADAVCIYRPGNVLTKSWAVLLRGIKAINQPDSIIYNSHTFSIGEDVCLEQGNKTGNCRLAKLLYATPAIVHAELIVNK